MAMKPRIVTRSRFLGNGLRTLSDTDNWRRAQRAGETKRAKRVKVTLPTAERLEQALRRV